MTFSNGSVFNGRYELRSQIARGGTAQVYLARDLLLDRPVALKILMPELSADSSFVERFRREAQAAANLSHPNIVPVFDWGEADQTYFIVMEYVDGEPLSSIIRTQAPLEPNQVASIAADIAKALSYAHRHGVVHRDVKPGNVLITADGQIKVTDFGIARAMGSDEQVTQTGLVMGTATYFSPEQAQGFDVDGRSDVYSLGVVLYEMAAGRTPFTGDTPVAIAYQHVREQPPMPRSVNPAIPVALEAIILQAMAKLPAERYPTADELRADLERFVRGQTVLAKIPSDVASGPVTSVIPRTKAGDTTVHRAVEQWDEEAPSTTRWWVAGGVALVVVLLLMAYFGGRALGYFGGGTYLDVPNVVNMSENAAVSELHAKGLSSQIHPVTGTPADVGKVQSQDPSSGASVKSGSTITLDVAGRPPNGTVPPVTTLQLQDAESQLTAAGFKVKTKGVKASVPTQTQNEVISQSPAPNASAAQGSTVMLTFVKGNALSTVPAFSNNESQAAAGAALTSAKLSVGAISMVFSSTVPSGSVVSSEPASGSQVPPGTTVNLNISEGPGVDVPNLVGQSETQAVQLLEAAGLTPTVGAPAATQDPNDIGNVYIQSPLPGTQVAPNSTVKIRLGVCGQVCQSTSTTTTTLPGQTTTSTPGATSTTFPGQTTLG